MVTRPAGKRSKKRIIAYKVILVLLPLLLLSLVEAGLRIFHYGYNTNLFIEYPVNKDYLVMNPEAARKFFVNKANATIGNIEPFKKEKDSGTLRIFVLGESTTIGYPYFHNGSFHRWLGYRLMRSMPSKPVEIINLSLTAVNSYTVLDFAKQLLPYQPDAVLIYSGQNEYYGALGVGSTEQTGGSRAIIQAILWLREFKIVQLLNNLFHRSPEADNQNETRLQRMVGDQQIDYASTLYQKGVDQFRWNMDKTLELLNDHRIPVFLSNLVSNEKDLVPFIGEDARRNYTLAQTALHNGAIETARQYFTLAKDLDRLRLRAPEKLNEIIEELCKKYNNVSLVDTKKTFSQHSAYGIIGRELLLEHVHPNLYGYALMSDAFYTSMKSRKIIAPETEMPFDTLISQMPVSRMDSLAAAIRIRALKKSWPFSQALTTGKDTALHREVTKTDEELAMSLYEKKITWLRANELLYSDAIGKKDFQAARKIAEGLVLEYPLDAAYSDKAAMLSGEIKDEQRALTYFKRSFALAPTFEKARYIFVLYLKNNDPVASIPYLDYAIANNSTRFNLQSIKDSVVRLIQANSVKKP